MNLNPMITISIELAWSWYKMDGTGYIDGKDNHKNDDEVKA